MKKTVHLSSPLTDAYLVHRGRLFRVNQAESTASIVTDASTVTMEDARTGLDWALASLPSIPQDGSEPPAGRIVEQRHSESLSDETTMSEWLLLDTGEAAVLTASLSPSGDLMTEIRRVNHPHAGGAVKAYCTATDAVDLVEGWLRLSSESPHHRVLSS